MAPITRADILRQLIETAALEDEWLRESIDATAFAFADAEADLKELAQRAQLGAAAAEARWKLRTEAWADLPPEPLDVLPAVAATHPNGAAPDQYRRREGLIFDVLPKGRDVLLRTPDIEIGIPGAYASMLDLVLSRQNVSKASLAAVGPDATDEHAEALLRALSQCGVLVAE
jgi:hypothetical protein